MPRRVIRSSAASTARRSTRRAAAVSTDCTSICANAAPRQRRRPPPNGISVNGCGLPAVKRSGSKRCGSGQRSARVWVRYEQA